MAGDRWDSEYTIWVEINSTEYEFQVDADEWERMTPAEREGVLTDCEMEARDMYCPSRTTVTVSDADGNEVQI